MHYDIFKISECHLTDRAAEECRCVAVGSPFCTYLSRLARLEFIHFIHLNLDLDWLDFVQIRPDRGEGTSWSRGHWEMIAPLDPRSLA
jgi:hypothetical protein